MFYKLKLYIKGENLSVLFILLGVFFYSFSTQAKTNKEIKIAIIDSGMDVSHPFLKKHIWINPGEVGIDTHGKDKSSNGIDDDGNGFVDDVKGWDFVSGTPLVQDRDGHGTHIAGIIKKAIAKTENSTRYKLIPLKYYDTKSVGLKGNHFFYLSALKYAIDMGAQVINISGGGYKKSKAELRLLQYAESKNVLVVAAAGNKKGDSVGNRPFYPAAYSLSNIRSVAATNATGDLLATSNLNVKKINIYKPGQKVYSSLPGNRFGFKTGSSQAAAQMTGQIVANMLTTDKETLSASF